MLQGAEKSPVSLRWKHALAAWWAITWPCWLIATLSLFALQDFTQLSSMQDPANIALALNGLIFVGQGGLLFRLTGKNFRTFWIGVLRNRDLPGRKLLIGEQVRVWWQFLFPQLLCIAALQLLSFASLTAARAEAVNLIVFGLRFFLIGPLSIYWALSTDYHDFRLQAFAHQFNQERTIG
jgi:hypothetical protein